VHRERAAKAAGEEDAVTGRRVHGRSNTREFATWRRMINRCHNPNAHNYKHYGGRGICVAECWRGPSGFESFFAHVGPRPSPKHSIDRIDNNGNYEPGNVRWATQREQNNNSGRTCRIRILDEELPLTRWAERMGVAPALIRVRLRRGWSEVDAVTKPPFDRGQERIRSAAHRVANAACELEARAASELQQRRLR
jgi:hypothetical protein